MKKANLPILFLLIIAFLFVGGCKMNEPSEDFIPEGKPQVEYNEVAEIYFPQYFNSKTGCYGNVKISNRQNDGNGFAEINSFQIGSDLRIGFLIIVKSGHRFLFSGMEQLSLYRFEETSETWEEIDIKIVEGEDVWVNGSILTLDYYLNIGKDQCYFLPKEPIYFEIVNPEDIVTGRYRLYTWGFEMEKNVNVPKKLMGSFGEFVLEAAPTQ
jgi:hypothetical protein